MRHTNRHVPNVPLTESRLIVRRISTGLPRPRHPRPRIGNRRISSLQIRYQLVILFLRPANCELCFQPPRRPPPQRGEQRSRPHFTQILIQNHAPRKPELHPRPRPRQRRRPVPRPGRHRQSSPRPGPPRRSRPWHPRYDSARMNERDHSAARSRAAGRAQGKCAPLNMALDEMARLKR